MDLASAHTNAKALILSLRDGVERLEKAEAVSFFSDGEQRRRGARESTGEEEETTNRCRVEQRRRQKTEGGAPFFPFLSLLSLSLLRGDYFRGGAALPSSRSVSRILEVS